MLPSTIFLHPLTLWNVNDTAVQFKRWLHPSYHQLPWQSCTDNVPAHDTNKHAFIRKAIPKTEGKNLVSCYNHLIILTKKEFLTSACPSSSCSQVLCVSCRSPLQIKPQCNKNCFLSQMWLHAYLSPTFNYCQLSVIKNLWHLDEPHDCIGIMISVSTFNTLAPFRRGTDKSRGFEFYNSWGDDKRTMSI